MRTSSLLARTFLPVLLLVAASLHAVPVPEAEAQSAPADPVQMALPDGRLLSVEVERHRGFPAFEAGVLEPLGWSSSDRGEVFELVHRTGIELGFRPGSPFVDWEGAPVQMVDAPYHFGDGFYLPLQLLVDLLPGFFPQAYQWDPELRSLQVEGAEAPDDRPAVEEDPDRAPRVVVIDPGHGGHDTGAVGPGGVTEKEVALALSRALARVLEEDPSIEVRLTREADAFVPLWERGAMATEWKEERPGVFLSIHANGLLDRPDVRGFETYFISEARTEHERRVAAAENAPLRLERPDEQPPVDDPLLAEIIRDLRTFDHQHWSALLAEIVQDELATFHPGPDRGVKQGPFAVITNAMMPSVLVEVGFLSHREEERLLTDPEFHEQTARALARSVERFFQRYPPGSAAR